MINLDLSGKRALICGASQGMGQACAKELADLGAEIILLARNKTKLESTLHELSTAHNQQHQYLTLDLADHDTLLQTITTFLSQHGRIDILINNSGGPKPGPIKDADVAVFQAALDSHLKAAILLTQLVLPGMQEAGFGRIINITSTSVKTPLYNLGVSNTTRWAIAAWAKTLSYEVARDGITVNTVLPGSIDTKRSEQMIEIIAKQHNCNLEEARQRITSHIPAGYLGSTKQFADVVAFLASPAASYVNGVALAVDGGRTPTI